MPRSHVEMERLIRSLVVPALRERPLDQLALLHTKIEEAREHTVVEVPKAERGGVSRRNLLQGVLKEDYESATEKIDRLRPLPLGLRQLLHWLLLQAHLAANGRSLAAWLGSSHPARRVSLIGQLGSATTTVDSFIALRLDGVAFRSAGQQAAQQLGRHGEYLQRFTRQLKERVAHFQLPNYQPRIVLDIPQAFSELYAGTVGKMLGACVGLLKVSEPYPLSLWNLIRETSLENTITHTQALQEFLRLRQMDVGLGMSVHTHAELDAWLAATCLHEIIIPLRQLPTLQPLPALLGRCREAEMPVVLDGRGVSGAGVIGVQLARAAGAQGLILDSVSAVVEALNQP